MEIKNSVLLESITWNINQKFNQYFHKISIFLSHQMSPDIDCLT